MKAKTNVERVARVKKRRESNRTKQISESTRAARAVACDPVRVDLGKINLLTSIPVKSILAEEYRLRGMVDAFAEETQAGLIERPPVNLPHAKERASYANPGNDCRGKSEDDVERPRGSSSKAERICGLCNLDMGWDALGSESSAGQSSSS